MSLPPSTWRWKLFGVEQGTVLHRPRLLSDNGSSYISADLAKWLDSQDMDHVRDAPYHPTTQGKIERWSSDAEEPHPARELLSAGRPSEAIQLAIHWP